MKYIPLANLKNATGIVATCKDTKEPVVANKNGEPLTRIRMITHKTDRPGVPLSF